MNLFCNPNLVENIILATETLQLATTSGDLKQRKKSTVLGFGEDYLNPILPQHTFAALMKLKRNIASPTIQL